MKRFRKFQKRPASAFWLGTGAVTFVVAVLGAAVWLISARLERQVQQQILDRDAYALHSVFMMQVLSKQDAGGADWGIKDPLNQLTAILETSRLKGVLAARLYSPAGNFLFAVPNNVASAPLNAVALREARQLKPSARFDAQGKLHELFEGDRPTPPVPLVRVTIPIHALAARQLDGIAEFILDGHPVAAEYSTLASRLSRHGLIVFLLAAGLIGLVIGWSLRRLSRINHALAARTAELVRANEELTLAAKTSAIGSVAAHLMHGLRNPLAGLQNFVTAGGGAAITSSDWELAADATARMGRLMDETVRVLTEEHGITRYNITSGELASLLRSRMTPPAEQSDVKLDIVAAAESSLPNREANIVLLVLQNLVKNAIDCTLAGHTVSVRLFEDASSFVCEVSDAGPGLPEHVRDNLFRPVRSTKPDGAGIGLAICKQLAAHIAAELTVKKTSREGTVFALTLPAKTHALKVA